MKNLWYSFFLHIMLGARQLIPGCFATTACQHCEVLITTSLILF